MKGTVRGTEIYAFVSSSFKHELEREFVVIVLEQLGIEDVRWPENAPPGANTHELFEDLQGAHVFVLLVNEATDFVKLEVKNAISEGIPVLAVGRPGPRGGKSKGEKWFRGKYPDIQVSRYTGLRELELAVRSGMRRIIGERLRSAAELIPWTERVYSEAGKLIPGTRRYAVVQRSSSLVLGPRSGGSTFEADFIDLFYELIGRAMTDADGPQVLHALHAQSTLQEIAASSASYEDTRNALKRFKKLVSSPLPNNVRFVVANFDLTPVVVADTRVGWVTEFDGLHYVWLRGHEAAANSLWKILASQPTNQPRLVDFLVQCEAALAP